MNERTRIGQTIGLVFLAWALIAVFMFFLLSYQSQFGSAAVPDATPSSTFWVTNGTVYDMVATTNTLYIGGDFSFVGPNTGYFAAIDETTGDPDLSFPYINGYVYDIVSDGSGGWYVGGDFTTVGGNNITNLAHINSDGSVDTDWTPSPNNVVTALALSGSELYVIGNFTSIGGASRANLAALDVVSGDATAWSPSTGFDLAVNSLAVGDDAVYVGGYFTTAGGETRNKLAAFDIATGALSNWNPNVTGGHVTSLTAGTSTIYVGGWYTGVGGESRNNIAEIDATTGSSTSWDPGSSVYPIYSMVLTSSSVFIAGGDATNSARVAEIERASGNFTAWNPTIGLGEANDLAVGTSTVYVGGLFTITGGSETIKNLVAFDRDTGLQTAWAPGAGDRVRAVALGETTVYAGGDFRSVGGRTRNGISAIDLSTGEATSWNPNTNGAVVETLSVTGTSLYAGGNFSTIGGNARNRIAEIDLTTGSSTAWNPNADDTVNNLLIGTSTMFVSGDFTAVGGEAREKFAEVDLATGLATSWNPGSDGLMQDMLIVDDTLYVAGFFSTLDGETRNNIAAFDLSDKSLTAWNPNANATVRDIESDGSNIYAGGDFTTIGGDDQPRLVALSMLTGSTTSWNPVVNQNISALSLESSVLYVGGSFSQLNGVARVGLGALSTVSGIPTPWNPNVAGSAFAIVVSSDMVYVGGGFASPNNGAFNLAAFSFEPNNAPSLSALTATPQTDGTGNVSISVAAADADNENLNIKVEYVLGDCSVYAGQTGVTLSDAALTSGTATLNNALAYQIGGVVAPNTLTINWQSEEELSGAEGEYCLFLTPNDDSEDGVTVSTTIAIDNIDPTAPSALSEVSSSTTSVVLNLSSTTSTDTNFSEYKIFYTTGTTTPTADHSSLTSSTDANLGSSTFNDATTTTISGLTAGQQYTASIWAYDTYGNYASSTAVTFTTVAAPGVTPGTPTVSTASSADTVYRQALDVIIDPGENVTSTTEFAICTTSDGTTCDASGYVISTTAIGVDVIILYNGAEANSSNLTIWRTYEDWGGESGVVVNGLTPGEQYQFLVLARGGDGVVSEPSDANDPVYARPNTPTNIETSDITQTSFTLSWSANGNPEGILYYLIVQGEDEEIDIVSVDTETTLTVSSLTCGTEYEYGFGAATPDLEQNDGEGLVIPITTAACSSEGESGGGGGGGGFIPPPTDPPVEPPVEPPIDPIEPEEPTEPVEPTDPPVEPPVEPPTEPTQPTEPTIPPTEPPTTLPTTQEPALTEPDGVDPGTSEPVSETPVDAGGTGETPVDPVITTPSDTSGGGIVVPPEDASDVSSLMYRLDTLAENIKERIQGVNATSIRDVLSGASERIVTVVKQVQQAIDNPEVEQVNERMIAPTVAAIAVANAAVGIGLPQALVFLKYLFTQPLLLLRRRKQKGWGTVYNAFTKQPVDLATIRIFDSKTNNLIRSQVTDREGRYFLMLDPGEYRIEVDKSGFAPGSEMLHGKTEDASFANLYHIGQLVTVTEAQSEINLNIPLDPAGQDKPTSTIIREYTNKIIHHTISTLGLVITVGSFIISPTLLIGSLLVLHVGAYGLFHVLSHKKLKGSVGVVVSDGNDKEPLGKVAIRVFDAAYDKLIDTAVTDSKGRYAMLVGPSTYYVTYDKPGFEKKQSPTIDYSSEKTQGRGAMIARNESLKKASEQIGTPLPPPPAPQEPVNTVDQNGNM